MAKSTALKGRNLTLFVGDDVITLSTSCKASITAQTTDAETKDDAEGGFDIEYFTIEASIDGQLDTTMTENKTLLSTMLAKTEVSAVLGVPSNSTDEEVPEGGWIAPTAATGKLLVFSAKITQFDIDAALGSKATRSITLRGTKPITSSAVPTA